MRIYFDDLIELAVMIVALYGLFSLVKKVYQKIRSTDVEKRRNVFNAAKIFLIGIIAGLVLYLTPFVNETIKIIISLGITLGAFIGTFAIKEKHGYNFNTRITVFIGQIFFGITMLLLMVNTNLGYSVVSVFGIWTIFNLYISRQFSKTENVFMFITTLIMFGGLAIGNYNNDIDLLTGVSGIVIILSLYQLLKQLFEFKENFIMKAIHNVLMTTLPVMIISSQNTDEALMLFVITIIFVIGMLFLLAINKEKINLKSFLVYIPILTVFLLSGFDETIGMLISIHNLMLVMWLLAEKSVYKKLLVVILMLVSVCAMLDAIYLDGLFRLIIVASTALTFVYLFEPKKVVKLAEGEGNDEE